MGRKRKSGKHLPPYVIEKHGGFYYIKDGKWRHIGRTLTEAMVGWSKIIEKKDDNTLITMNDVINRYVAEVIPKKATNTKKSNMRYIATLKKVFGHMSPQDITRVDILRFKDEFSRATTETEASLAKSLLSHIMTKAMDWGLIKINPCTRTGGIISKRRTFYLSETHLKEIINFLSKNHKQMSQIVKLGLMTGARKGDLLALTWDNVTKNEIRFICEKTKKPIRINMNDKLRSLLDEIKQYHQNAGLGQHLFKTKRGHPYSKNGFDSVWRWIKNQNFKLFNGVKFHDLRSIAINRSIEIGIDPGKLTGNTSSVIDRYIRNTGVKVDPVSYESF